MDSSGFENLLNIAIKASVGAGLEILKIYTNEFSIDFKADHSPITQADKNAHSFIIQILEETGIPIFSEEGFIPDFEIRKNWDYCWLIDPLDGTKEFVKRNGEFTVNIALIEKGNPILGVIYAPVLKCFYYAANDEAYVSLNINPEWDSEKIVDYVCTRKEKLNTSRPGDVIRILASRSHFSPETQNHIQKLEDLSRNIELKSIGSSLKFCMIAEGKADFYPRFSTTMEWDTAAGHAILVAAGGKVLDAKSGEPLSYNKENLSNPWFIASNK